ncbi:class I SAM-dependent methyltransferase [Opitutaceae bacterium]|nr:class I SAM-dependent methyltransferase [Opitutaceae bacterium]
MIQFHHDGHSVDLKAGEIWRSSSIHPDNSYRDTPEKTLWSIVDQINSGLPWREVVASHYAESFPWLHRIVCDSSRDLYFRQYPAPSDSLVLDIGAGWGQISLPMAKQNRVVALEPTSERLAFIKAIANQENVSSRVAFIESDFLDLEFQPVFDLVCCIGVLEWVPKYRTGLPRELQRDFLERMLALLAPGGSVVVGIENRLGLKYFLGGNDDHIGSPNIAVLDAELANRRFQAITGNELRSYTYSRAEYIELFAEAGFSNVTFYASFPDYKLPALIHPADASLEALLANGAEIPDEHDGSNGIRLPDAMQEVLQSHYKSLAKNRISQYFAPSYFIRASVG